MQPAPQYGCRPVLENRDPVVEEVNAQWFGRVGVEAEGLHSYNNNLTFIGPLTIAIGGPWADFAHYANDC